jgi:hypothetical protein
VLVEKSITKLTGVAKEDFDRPLDMCVSIVIDEAGTVFYEEIKNGDTLYGKLNDQIWTKSVALIISGSGLTAELLNLQSQAKKYRMKEWTHANVIAVRENYITNYYIMSSHIFIVEGFLEH